MCIHTNTPAALIFPEILVYNIEAVSQEPMHPRVYSSSSSNMIQQHMNTCTPFALRRPDKTGSRPQERRIINALRTADICRRQAEHRQDRRADAAAKFKKTTHGARAADSASLRAYQLLLLGDDDRPIDIKQFLKCTAAAAAVAAGIAGTHVLPVVVAGGEKMPGRSKPNNSQNSAAVASGR